MSAQVEPAFKTTEDCPCGCLRPDGKPLHGRLLRSGHVRATHPPVVVGVQGFVSRPAPERFWERVDRSGPRSEHRPDLGPCWLWTGATTGSKEYGRFTVAKGQAVVAHRWSYEHLVGPIPAGLVIDHLCRVHRCVNPAHLEPVTTRENILRGVSTVAKAAKQDRCVKGHPFDYVSPRQRVCRICQREASRRYKARKRQRAAA